jgi:ABC-type transporter Mla maintaining outer membrane lipid asymmetry ATPase subunit MlaF
VTKTEQPLIQVRGLLNRFGNQIVHENLDLDVCRGEILGVQCSSQLCVSCWLVGQRSSRLCLRLPASEI